MAGEQEEDEELYSAAVGVMQEEEEEMRRKPDLVGIHKDRIAAINGPGQLVWESDNFEDHWEMLRLQQKAEQDLERRKGTRNQETLERDRRGPIVDRSQAKHQGQTLTSVIRRHEKSAAQKGRKQVTWSPDRDWNSN